MPPKQTRVNGLGHQAQEFLADARTTWRAMRHDDELPGSLDELHAEDARRLERDLQAVLDQPVTQPQGRGFFDVVALLGEVLNPPKE